MKAKLDVDATKLFEALKYQIHVAIEYCHALSDDESLWVEVFGDVTVGADSQIEVKDYEDDLTDSHENLWNTLNNWLKPEFNHELYRNLILLTTQTFGANSTLKDWNQKAPKERLAILEGILAASEERHAKPKKAGAADAKLPEPSKALKLQRKVFADERRDALLSALPKIQIVTDQPGLLEHIEWYKRNYLRPLPPNRQDDYLGDLFGFITSAAKITNGWEISSAEFTAKTRELTARYMVGTVKFPPVNHEVLEQQASAMDVSERSFALKLSEIGGQKFIPRATADLLHAQHYIAELIKDCGVFQPDFDSYRRNHHQTHCSGRLYEMEGADPSLSHAELQTLSRKFYLRRCQESVMPFCSFENTPTEFRNGIYQMLADEPAGTGIEGLYWRLWD